MSGSVVVGYTATDAGADAAALGAHLARSLEARVHLVLVLPSEGTRSAAVPPARAFEDVLRTQGKKWLADAMATLPQDLTRSGHVRFAESFSEGLVAAGEEFGARVIVAGSVRGGMFGRYRLGSVANELVHSSPIPVALAPAGFSEQDDHALSRITVAVGTRAGADILVEQAAALSAHADVPLRLVSLVSFDVPAGMATATIRAAGEEHAASALSDARKSVPADIVAETDQVTGGSVEEAVATLSWLPGEVILVGSSRLAQPRRLFLGSTAAKMLHELPVPMIVVPSTRATSKETAHEHHL